MIQPQNNWVIIKTDDPIEEMQGGIIIPQTVRRKARYATVVSIGDGLPDTKTGIRYSIDFKVGDRIVYDYRDAKIDYEFFLEGEKHNIISAEDIDAVITE